MTNFDIDNWEELQPYKDYNYDLIEKEYPVEENNADSTYNQFIQLRDTLVYSTKHYKWKWGSKLIIWEKEETVEIIWRNAFRQSFQSVTDWIPTLESIWPYVKRDYAIASMYWPISCEIQKDGRYRISHKEEVLPNSWQSKVYCYIDVYRPDGNGWYTMPYKWGISVFDRQGSGTLSGWDASVSFTLWKIFQKMTAIWYMERDLKKWDILVLRTKDQDIAPDWSPQWNDLTLQADSNYWSIEYIDLPIN